MALLAALALLVALFAAGYMYLLSGTSYAYLHERFPVYANIIYRQRRGIFQEGPIRVFALLTTPPPGGDTVAVQLRTLSIVTCASAALALLFWALA